MVSRDPQDKLGLKGHQGHRETLDLLGILEQMERQELLVPLVSQDYEVV